MDSYNKIILGLLISLFLTGCINNAAKQDAPMVVKPNLTQPTVFNTSTAMLAIFGAYNSKEKGTLLPTTFTNSWNLKKADTFASPLLVKTYTESGANKGVLVAQRKNISDGVVEGCHACAPEISVYVFNFIDGKWIFEKGKKSVAQVGANGNAPTASLINIGDQKFGVLFEGGDIHQGYTSDYAFITPISDKTIVADAPLFDMGQSNAGACSEDAKEQADYKLEPCWKYSGKINFININEPYYAINLQYVGDVDHQKSDIPLINNADHYEKASMGNYRYVDFTTKESSFSF